MFARNRDDKFSDIDFDTGRTALTAGFRLPALLWQIQKDDDIEARADCTFHIVTQNVLLPREAERHSRQVILASGLPDDSCTVAV